MDSTQNENNTIQSSKFEHLGTKSVKKYIIAALLISLSVIGATLLLASKSLPGETLYSLKTNGVERIVEKSHISSKNKAWYQVTKMKTRLEETKQLASQDTVSEKAFSDINTQITNHTATLESIVEASIDSAFPKTDLLYTLNEFASIAGGIEAIGENKTILQRVGDTAEDARQNISSTYKKRVLSFVQTETPQSVYTYIQTELSRVKDAFGEEGVSKETIRTSGNYLDRVEPALVKSDFNKAVLAIGEAYRIITIEKYADVIVPLNTDLTTPSSSSTPQKQSTTTKLQATTPITLPI